MTAARTDRTASPGRRAAGRAGRGKVSRRPAGERPAGERPAGPPVDGTGGSIADVGDRTGKGRDAVDPRATRSDRLAPVIPGVTVLESGGPP